MSNPCPVPGCTGTQGAGKLMCLRHWRMVSGPTQKEVYRTWRAFQRAAAAASLLALRTYRTARDAAIAEAGHEQRLHDGGEG